jgi:hypothetical protein
MAGTMGETNLPRTSSGRGISWEDSKPTGENTNFMAFPFRTPKRRKAFLAALSKTANVTHACTFAPMSRDAAYKWRAADPEFKKEWEDAIEKGTDLLVLEARRRAFRGTRKPVFYKGAIAGYIREYSDVLLMFLIKERRPEYRESFRQIDDGGDDSSIFDDPNPDV